MKPVLAIGDSHGHLDRLEALLVQEGIIGRCQVCDGSGACNASIADCEACDGLGVARINNEVTVVHLGDLGHFGLTGSPTGDELCWRYSKNWIDIQLWGNHDRAVVCSHHRFSGYRGPNEVVRHMMNQYLHEGRLRLAYGAHGFLLTHAGLHAQFKDNDVHESLKTNATDCADWLNLYSDEKAQFNPESKADRVLVAVVDAIGYRRGGRSPFGGILWRDASEKLFTGYRQVFGHSAKGHVRQYVSQVGNSYCIDVGTEHNGRLCGMWLPEERVVEVDLSQISDGTSTLHDQDPHA